MSPAVRDPLQERSHESLRRILDAAEDVLAKEGYEKASLAAICRRAGLTTGAFYARFSSKEDLLGPLLDRFEAEVNEAIDALDVDPARLRHPLRVAVERFIRAFVRLYRTRRGLLRALTASARASTGVRRKLQMLNARIGDAIIAKLSRYRAEMSHPDPARAQGFALLCLFSALREVAVEQQLLPPDRYRLSDAQLARELTRLFLGYVGAGS